MSATRERPILFSGPMVRAILDGRKTQTRRVVTPQHCPRGVRTLRFENQNAEEIKHSFRCPYGAPGDRLWVRESWCYDCSTVPTSCIVDQTSVATKFLQYRADWASGKGRPSGAEERWRSPCRMWRWASRISLEVVRVRVERVREISEADAAREGAEHGNVAGHDVDINGEVWNGVYRRAFARLWDSINAKRGFGWAVNPWVWVVEFKRVDAKSGGGA